MAKFKVTKIEAARRQLDAAIRMLFMNEDIFAIHTVTMSAFRVLRDLAGKKDNSAMNKFMRETIKPGKEKAFWGSISYLANFLKHADKDGDVMSNQVDEKVNDYAIQIACWYYQDLCQKLTPEMQAFSTWFMAIHPDLLVDALPSRFRVPLDKVKEDLLAKSREEQLAVGKQLLIMANGMMRDV
jgi:hypothetical protein